MGEEPRFVKQGNRLMRCAVVGAGAWGTALADLLKRNGHDVALWAFEKDVAESISTRRENLRFLKGHQLAAGIQASSDIARVVDGAELVVFATPSTVLRNVASAAAKHFRPASAGSGRHQGNRQESTCALMTDVVAAEISAAAIVALSGPSFAAEVVRCQPTAVVVASADERVALAAQQAFNSPYFRRTHRDVIGVEIGGALKNVMAVATGVADGLGLGHNARAALITRGLAEMTRLGTSLGAEASTFAGLAGLGDLVLTCTGSLSRNREVGVEGREGEAARRSSAGAGDGCRGSSGCEERVGARLKTGSGNADRRSGKSCSFRGAASSRGDGRADDKRVARGGGAMKTNDPVQEFYSIGDVCELTDLKPHVLRYWESQFRFLHPAKNRSGNRVYQRKEIELIMLVKQLLYEEKFTIDGARQKIDDYRKEGELRTVARAALDLQAVVALENDLKGILRSSKERTTTRNPLE